MCACTFVLLNDLWRRITGSVSCRRDLKFIIIVVGWGIVSNAMLLIMHGSAVC